MRLKNPTKQTNKTTKNPPVILGLTFWTSSSSMFKGERVQSSQLLRLSHVLRATFPSLFSASVISLLLFQTLMLVGEADHCRRVTAPSSNATQGRSGRWFLRVLNWFCCLRKRSLLLWVFPAIMPQKQSALMQLIGSQLQKWWRVKWAWPFGRKNENRNEALFFSDFLIITYIFLILLFLLWLVLFCSGPILPPPRI